MTVITTLITVALDGTVSTATPLGVGEYTAQIEVPDTSASHPAGEPVDVDDWPVHDFGPWPTGLSLRREDMYGDDGR